MTDELVALSDVLARADEQLVSGNSAAPRTWPVGFSPLDTYLGGGVRAGELVLVGGPQGLGKTTWVLQAMRNVVNGGGAGIYFSFEHDEQTILERLVALESAALEKEEGVPLRKVREAMQALDGSRGSLRDRLVDTPGAVAALDAIAGYDDRFQVHRSSGRTTTIDIIRQVVLKAAETEPPLVVVDYLQKVNVDGDEVEEERVTRIVEGLKDLALEAGVPVLAVVAADKEGLNAGKRLRVHHLRGSSALAYEADVVLLLNDKYDVVARHHLVYDTGSAERFRAWAVMSIEKNRSGLDKIDMEFAKRFEQGRFDPEGRLVGEQLMDERIYVE